MTRNAAAPSGSNVQEIAVSKKLTKAQKELLVDISNGDDRCSDAYLPARKLIDMGLCVWASEIRLGLTEAGRLALRQQESRT